MTPPPDNLTSVVFRALYPEFELLVIGAAYVVVPKGTPLYIGDSLGGIAQEISDPPSLGELLLWEDPLPRRPK